MVGKLLVRFGDSQGSPGYMKNWAQSKVCAHCGAYKLALVLTTLKLGVITRVDFSE